MITSPTVFILGAGASCSYGYPSGKDLKEKCVQIVNGKSRTRPDDPQRLSLLSERAIISLEECSQENLLSFSTALENSMQLSIDAFLHANRKIPSFKVIGKAAIAQVLLYERQPPQHDDDWLRYLLGLMADGATTADEFLQNKVSFVTFNYDSYLEYRIQIALQHSYGITEKEAETYLKQIPIYHVYGKIDAYKAMHNPNNLEWVEASQKIKTIFEAEKDIPSLDGAKNLLSEARKICLLGFGFHKENIDILDLETHIRNCVKGKGFPGNEGLVVSSWHDITEAEWSRLTASLVSHSIHRWKNSPAKCLQTLRQTPLFN